MSVAPYCRMLAERSTYEALYGDFRWQIPGRFNIGTAVSDAWAARTPDRVCLQHFLPDAAPLSMTYGELAARSDAFAAALVAEGVQKGDRVAILLPQGFETVIAHVAAYKLGAIALPLARSISDRRRVVVDPCGQESKTRYEVISQHAMIGRPEARSRHDSIPVSLVRCELVTGRTHQIRVHLAARGWPVLGDAVYGEPHPAIARQALHAWRASVPHPATRAPLTIEAPLPPDLQTLVDQNLTL